MNTSTSLNQEQKDKVIDYLNKYDTEKDFFALLGRSLGGAASGEPPEERGKNAFRRRLVEIKSAVCSDVRINSFCEDTNTQDITQLAIIIIETLLGVNFTGLDPIILGCLITRIGLRNICKNELKEIGK